MTGRSCRLAAALAPLDRRHAHFAVEHHGEVVTVLKSAAHRHLTHHQFRVLQQILCVADPQLAQVMINRHTGLRAELLAQCPLAALLLLAELLHHKAAVQAARQSGDEFVEQGFLLIR